MHPFFEPLDERETMLLLTTLTVGGSDEIAIFEHLPAASRRRLEDKARALAQIPKEKRVAFIVHEMKRALATRGSRGGLERIDPSWLLQGLKGESPRVVAAVLVSLPSPTMRAILERLPRGIRQRLPSKEDMKSVPAALVDAVRQMFELRFAPMPHPPARRFSFRDILHLERSEIYRLMRDLGLVELGQAFVSVGKMALAELCRRLPRERAEELVLAVGSAPRVDLPDLKSAQRFLSRVAVNFTDTEEFFQKAGLWRLAKASIFEPPAFRAAFRQRLPREAGDLYAIYVAKAAEMPDLGEDVIERLQDSILLRVRELVRRGDIAAQWGELEMRFHDPHLTSAASAPSGTP